MTILVLTNNIGGLYSFRKEVMQAFIDNGYKVIISAPYDGDQRISWFENIGCEFVNTSFNRQGTNPLADLKLMLRYRKMIKQIKPVAVLTYTIKPNLYGGMACALAGVPQIANITGLGAAVEYPGPMQKVTMLLYKIGLRKTWLTFFQNKENMEFCQKHGMVKGRTQLIPGSGVNLEHHKRIDYPTESEPIRFLFMGRIRREKGIDELRDLFKDVTVDGESFWKILSDEINYFQSILGKSGFDFGFRVINEIVRFMAVAWKYEYEPDEFDNWTRYFDACIKQKMLPKLHGSEKIIGETLKDLFNACVGEHYTFETAKYPESARKLHEMREVLRKQRYVSFIN